MYVCFNPPLRQPRHGATRQTHYTNTSSPKTYLAWSAQIEDLYMENLEYSVTSMICTNLNVLAESFEACRISKMRHDTCELRISDKKIGMIDQS